MRTWQMQMFSRWSQVGNRYKNLFSDFSTFFCDSRGKRSWRGCKFEMGYFPNHFSSRRGRGGKGIIIGFHLPPVIKSVAQALTCHLRHVSSLSPRNIPSYLTFFLPLQQHSQAVPFQHYSVLQHNPWHKDPLLVSPPPLHLPSGPCSATRAVRNYPVVIGYTPRRIGNSGTCI